MANTFGVSFTIGAVLSSTVASAFGTVESKIQAARQKINASSREAKAIQKAIDLRGRRDELAAQFKDTGTAALRRELSKVSAEYRKAKTAALAYGGGVADWTAKQALARRELEHSVARMRLYQEMQGQRDKRGELRGQMVETAAFGLALAAPVRTAIQFESAMADAAKTIDGMRDPAGKLTGKYREMEAAIKAMGRELPLTHEQIANAGGVFMDSPEKLNQLMGLMAAFGVQAVPQLKPEQLGPFATELRKLGAQI